MPVTVEQAARYIDLGFVVHPCCPVSHRCNSPGKIPFDPVEGKHMVRWQEHEQFSLAQWEEWLDYDSELNIGFLTGSPSNLVCLDIDDEGGRRILDECGVQGWQDTWQYTTGRGFRYLFQHGETSVSTVVSRGSAHFEVLGDGRQSVLPPSVHPNGRQYRWVSGLTPRDGGPVSASGWIRGLTPQSEITSDREDWAKNIRSAVAQGDRNNTLTRLAGHLLNPCPMPPEEAYIWLSLYNQHYCNPPLSDREIKAIITSISKKEAAAEAQRDREIRQIMKQYDLSYEEAATVWRSM